MRSTTTFFSRLDATVKPCTITIILPVLSEWELIISKDKSNGLMTK